jgi:glyceraldehyde 3-phosphate dehydrogenase
MENITLGINGFGRIGRTLYRLLEKEPAIQVTLVNDLADAPTLGHLLKYDSIHGTFQGPVETGDDFIRTPSQKTRVTRFEHPSDIPWKEAGVDLVVESTGRFKTRETLKAHLEAGAPKVLLSAPPAEDQIPMIVFGINHKTLRREDRIFSNASCKSWMTFAGSSRPTSPQCTPTPRTRAYTTDPTGT